MGPSAGGGDGFAGGSCVTGLGVAVLGPTMPVAVAAGVMGVAVVGPRVTVGDAVGVSDAAGAIDAVDRAVADGSAPAVAVGGRVLLGVGAAALVWDGIVVAVADGAGGVQGDNFCPGALPEESGISTPAKAARISATPTRMMVVVDRPS